MSDASVLNQLVALSNRFATAEATSKAALQTVNKSLAVWADTNDKLSKQGIRLDAELKRISEIVVLISNTISEMPDVADLARRLTALESLVSAIAMWSSSPPMNPAIGQIWLNSAKAKPYTWDGANWIGIEEVISGQIGTTSNIVVTKNAFNVARSVPYDKFLLSQAYATASGGYVSAGQTFSITQSIELTNGAITPINGPNATRLLTTSTESKLVWNINQKVTNPVAGLITQFAKLGNPANLTVSKLAWVIREIL